MALLPKLTPATGLGATFVDAYAGFAGIGTDAYLEQLGSMLTAEQVADAVIHLIKEKAVIRSRDVLAAERHHLAS